jgi:general secretion pathway protein E
MDLGVEPYLIGATLLGVVAQRLVRTVCPHCKVPSPVDPAAWLALIGHAEIAMPEQIWSGRGCDECRHSGFLGREGIYEIMVVDARLRESIGPACGIDDIRRAALACGMRSLRVAGAAKIAAGRTTLTEVMSIVPPPDSGDRAPGTGDQPRG